MDEENALVVVENKCTYCKRFKGIFLIILSQFVFSLGNLSLKILTVKGYPALHACVWRGLTQALFAGVWLLYKKHKIFQKIGTRRWIIFRAISGTTTQMCIYLAISGMPLGDAMSIFSIAPILTMIIAYIWIGEILSVLVIPALLFGLTGIVLVIRPYFLFNRDDIDTTIVYPFSRGVASMFAITAAFSMAWTTTVIRKLRNVNSWELVFVFGAISVVIQTSFAIPFYHSPWVWAFYKDPMTFLLLTVSFLIANLSTLFAFFWQSIFESSPHYLSIIGTILILLGSLIQLSMRFCSCKLVDDLNAKFCCKPPIEEEEEKEEEEGDVLEEEDVEEEEDVMIITRNSVL